MSKESFFAHRYATQSVIVLFAILLFVVVYWVCGTIPVNAGTGWDGSIYLNYIERLARGESIHGDPYRLMRMPGFGPLIGGAALGLSPTYFLTFQMLLNGLVVSMGLALFYSALVNIGCKRTPALISTGLLMLTWPVLVMPVYYPLLSDHAALALSCTALWLWSKSLRVWLLGLCVLSVWVLPGLFLLPFILLCFPFKNHAGKDEGCQSAKVLSVSIFAASGIIAAALLLKYLLRFSVEEIAVHAVDKNGQTALTELLPLTYVGAILCVLYVAWIYSRLSVDRSVWSALSIKWLCVSLVVLASTFVWVYLSFDWSVGFAGPPLTKFMTFQSLAAPFKPLVAHFYAFGPVIILSLWSLYRWSVKQERNLPRALVVVLAAYLPFLLFGSESRQWIGVLPVSGAVFAMSVFSLGLRIWSVIYAVLLIAPFMFLQSNNAQALVQGLSYQSGEWQYYFSRQGPWMSASTYLSVAELLLVFVLVAILIERFNKRGVKSCVKR